MANIPNSLQVGGIIAPTDSLDTYPVTDPKWGLGGYRTVQSITDMNAITEDRREPLMLVAVIDDGIVYQLQSNTWKMFSQIPEEVLNNIDSNISDIEILSGDIKSVSINVESLSGDVKSVSGDIEILSGDIESLSGDISLNILNTNYLFIQQQDIEILSGDIESLSGDIESLSGDIDLNILNTNYLYDVQQQDIESLSGDIESLSGDIKSLSQNNFLNERFVTGTVTANINDALNINGDCDIILPTANAGDSFFIFDVDMAFDVNDVKILQASGITINNIGNEDFQFDIKNVNAQVKKVSATNWRVF